ncbi:MAG: hypothetical protein Q4C50_11230 [Eubacteriales bacterium]|nr:hypothetical protein [Eubacteriales bacterium]
MTEFEEITLKKIIKGKIVEEFYVNLNVMLGSNRIGNNELSRKIGWDPAGYNQKLNRKSDLRLSTLINMFVAISDLINQKNDTEFSFYEQYEEMEFRRLFTLSEFRLGELFLHISAVVDGEEEFLNTPERVKTYKSLRAYVLGKRSSPALSEKEKGVYMKYYDMV